MIIDTGEPLDWKFETNRNGNTPESLIDEFQRVHTLALNLNATIQDLTVHGRNFQAAQRGDGLNSATAFRNDVELKDRMKCMAEMIGQYAVLGAIRAIDQKEG